MITVMVFYEDSNRICELTREDLTTIHQQVKGKKSALVKKFGRVPGFELLEVDVKKQRVIAEAFGVTKLPAIIVKVNQEIGKRYDGNVDLKYLIEELKRIMNIKPQDETAQSDNE